MENERGPNRMVGNERGPNINWWMYEDGWRTRGRPNINWWMYEDGWRTRGDLTLTGGCTRMVGEREGT